MKTGKTVLALTLGAMMTLTACSTASVVDNTVDATGFVAKTAVKGTIGAGKLAVNGVRKVTSED